jgi:hypothetical protein
MDRGLLSLLTEPEDPSLCYRTLTELQDRNDQVPEVKALRVEIPKSQSVRRVLGSVQPDGYWLQKDPRTGRLIGTGVAYGSFGTTHFCLSYLSELGMDRNAPEIERAAERYLGLQDPDGAWNEEGWYRNLSCLLGYNIRTFIRLGYRDDPRLKRSIDLLLDTDRDDGGSLCGIHDRRYKTKQAKSCIPGLLKVLLGFAELPELHDHPRVKRLVDYFLKRGGIYKSTDTHSFVNKDMQRPSFPITWRANAWEVLYALSRMGRGDDPRLERAWKHLERLTDNRGASILTWTPAQCPWKVGKREQPSKWITFYVLAAA